MRIGKSLVAVCVVAATASIVAGDNGSAARGFAAQQQAERLLIDKSDRTLKIIFANGAVRTFRGVSFGPNWKSGPKRRRGDQRTPEGEYRVLEHRSSRDVYPDVTYLPALYLDYPNERDREASAELGVDPGDAIMIHGPHPDVAEFLLRLRGDWTDGCVALTAEQMDDLMRVTREGTPVTIQP